MAKSATKRTGDAATTASDRSYQRAIGVAVEMTEHDIARRAYDLYLARGCEHGRDVDDWLQAERELREAV